MSIAEKFVTMEYGPAPEDPKEAQAWLERHGRRFGHFINGAWQAPAAGEYFDTIDPSNGEKLASVAQGSSADIDAAVQAARAAFPKWRALTPHVRARYLYALARLVQKHSRLLAVLETMDNGKPIRESRDIDIPLVARHFYYHAGWAQLLDQEFPEYEPCGVVGQIIPWNFPLLMAGVEDCSRSRHRKHGGVEARGIYSSDGARFRRTLPGSRIARRSRQHRHRRRLDRRSAGQASRRGQDRVHRFDRSRTRDSQRHGRDPKRLSLELGGKSPFIVFDDADLDSAVEGLVDGIWFNQGQVCCAGSRLLDAGEHCGEL